MRIAVLASGAGSNLRVILEHCASGRLAASPVLALSNVPDCLALEHARAYNVPFWAKAHRGVTREDFDAQMLAAVLESGAEAVILAGYMRILSPFFIGAFPGRILNIHPALLPSFPGVSAREQALEHQVRLCGCTVHFVDESTDGGPIVIQGAVPLSSGDTAAELSERIQALEHRIYPQAVQWLAQGRLQAQGRGVTLLPRPGTALQPATLGESRHGPWMVSPALEDF